MGAAPSTGRSRRVLRWVALGLGLAALQAIWSVSMPLMASPDEPSHVVRAAAVARGQWSGAPGSTTTDPSQLGPPATVQLPSDYLAASTLQTCFAHHPEQPASCQATVPAPDGTTAAVTTFAGQYPPLYYLLVGWPSRFLAAAASIYAMRIVSGLIAASLTVWGLYRLRTATLPATWTWAAAAALTPMTLFLGGMVNPQALEISSAFAFWAACLALARSSGAPRRGAVVQAAVTGAMLLNTRSSGPVWALTIVAVALLLAPKGRSRVLWGSRPVRWALGVAVVAGLAAAAWVVGHGVIVTGSRVYREYSSPLRAAWFELAQTAEHLLQMIGNFGWLDTPSPILSVMVWIALVGALVAVSLAATSSPRERAALVVSVLAVVALPVLLQVPTAAKTGLIWQGRYTLPIAVGVPMVAALALTSAGRPLDEIVRRIVRWVALPAVAVAHVAAFWWAMRRYAVGVDGTFVTRSPQWLSPLGYLSAVAIYAVPVVVLGAAAWYALRPSRATGAEPGVGAAADERAVPPTA